MIETAIIDATNANDRRAPPRPAALTITREGLIMDNQDSATGEDRPQGGAK